MDGSFISLNMGNKNNNSRGFTIVETIAVIAIVGIIAAVAVPQFNNTIQTKRLYDAVEKLNDDLNYCRDYAISQHTNTWIRFRPNDERYRLFHGDTWATRIPLIDHARNSSDWFYIYNMFPDVGITSTSFTNNRISFNWWGTPSEGGTVSITNGTNSHTLTVKPETGYVER